MENVFQILLDEVKEVKVMVENLQVSRDQASLNKLYTIQEAAKILKVSTQSVKSYINKGTLKAQKRGRFYRIRHSDLYNSNNEAKSLKYKR